MYSCYYCNTYQTDLEKSYERHVILTDPKRPAYPATPSASRITFQKEGHVVMVRIGSKNMMEPISNDTVTEPYEKWIYTWHSRFLHPLLFLYLCKFLRSGLVSFLDRFLLFLEAPQGELRI